MDLSTSSMSDSFRGTGLGQIGEKAANKRMAKDSCCPSLTLKQRLYGFLICATLGFILDLLSFGMLLSLISGNLKRFALPYTFGVLLSLGSTFFLIGPLRQLKRMFARKRFWVALVLVLSIIATLVCGLTMKKPWGPVTVLTCIIIQWSAFIWYSLSYIPFGRKIAKKIIKGCCCKCFNS